MYSCIIHDTGNATKFRGKILNPVMAAVSFLSSPSFIAVIICSLYRIVLHGTKGDVTKLSQVETGEENVAANPPSILHSDTRVRTFFELFLKYATTEQVKRSADRRISPRSGYRRPLTPEAS